MSDTATKLSYLNDTKSLLKDRLNSLGATITSSTTFRNYLTWLDTFYEDVSNKTDIGINGIIGRTNQETTTGKNLLTLASIYNKTQYGISGTYNTDGSYTISGKGTQSGNAQITQNTPLVLDAGTYTFSIDHALSKKIYLHIKLSDNSYKNISLEAGETSVTDTLSLASTEYNFRYVIATDEVVNETIKMQLESGSTPTTFEKFTYGASPNPSYPQPVNNLTGNVDYIICGKNLFNINAQYYKRRDVDNVSISENNIIVQNEETAAHQLVWWNIPIESGKQITISYDSLTETNSNTNNAVYYLFSNELYNTFTEFTDFTKIDKTNKYATTTSTGKYLVVGLRTIPSTTNTLSKLQVEISSTLTDYEPYIEPKTVIIPLGDIELAEIGTYKDKIYKQNNKWYLEKNINKEILNGTESWRGGEQGTVSTDFRYMYTTKPQSIGASVANIKCNYLKTDIIYASTQTDTSVIGTSTGTTDNLRVLIDKTLIGNPTSKAEALTNWANWLSTHNTIVYYVLATPTTTEITSSNYPELYAALKEIEDYLVAYKINKEFILGYSSPTINY